MLLLRKRARILLEAADVLQPLLAGGTLLEGDFWWMCASVVHPRGFRSMGRTERPVLAWWPDMRQHMQQLQHHCLEVWTRRLSTLGAGRKDYFLAGYVARRPGGRGGGGGAARPFEIVCAQRPRAVGAALPRPPPAADVKPAPYRLCPIHLKPQCEQCRLPRRGVAHCCARGHEGHPVAVAGAAALSRVVQVWLAPLEPPPEPLAKRLCVAPAPAVTSRWQRPDCRMPSPLPRCHWVQSTLPWVGKTVPSPTEFNGHPGRGGGGGGYKRRASVSRS